MVSILLPFGIFSFSAFIMWVWSCSLLGKKAEPGQTVKSNLLCWGGWSSGRGPETTCHRDFSPAKNAHMLARGAVFWDSPPVKLARLHARKIGIYSSITHRQSRNTRHSVHQTQMSHEQGARIQAWRGCWVIGYTGKALLDEDRHKYPSSHVGKAINYIVGISQFSFVSFRIHGALWWQWEAAKRDSTTTEWAPVAIMGRLIDRNCLVKRTLAKDKGDAGVANRCCHRGC